MPLSEEYEKREKKRKRLKERGDEGSHIREGDNVLALSAYPGTETGLHTDNAEMRCVPGT